jgi:regulator of cell morphogenesis and NO signaling
MTATLDSTVRELVASDYRAAAVFQHYGIDFCCGGNRTIEQASADVGKPPEEILGAIDDAIAAPLAGQPRFNSWDLPLLVSYIVANHHAFVRQAIPTLLAHTRKVAAVHGAGHPEMVEVAHIFGRVADEMTEHMWKEEQVLFPYILKVARLGTAVGPLGTMDGPIRVMEADHESAGQAMARIRDLTKGYDLPANGCTTYRVCLRELEAFERDLHVHVHLENNILFPKAVRLDIDAAQRAKEIAR